MHEMFTAKNISSTFTAMSNFLLRLWRVHPTLIQKFEAHKNQVLEQRNRKRKNNPIHNENETMTKQMKLNMYVCSNSQSHTGKSVSQDDADGLIMRYIVNAMCSISTVKRRILQKSCNRLTHSPH